MALLCFYDFITVYLTSGKVATRIRSFLRVGPHNMDIMSIIYGSLLGDSHAERRTLGTRISFYQEAIHSQYLEWLHNMVSNLGYCTPTLPKILSRLGIAGKIRHVIRFHTFTYSSWNFIHDQWYLNGIKHVPANIADFLTPLALAI